MKQSDNVNKPKHYELFPNVEAIDVIQQVLSAEEFQGYLKGNALKYRLRAGKKENAMEDLAKANWYETRLQKEYQYDIEL